MQCAGWKQTPSRVIMAAAVARRRPAAGIPFTGAPRTDACVSVREQSDTTLAGRFGGAAAPTNRDVGAEGHKR